MSNGGKRVKGEKMAQRAYFDINQLPFSRYGSYFSVIKRGEELLIRDLHGGDMAPSHLYRIKLQPEWCYELTPTRLTIQGDGQAIFFVDKEDHLHIQTKGLGLDLEAFAGKYDTFIRQAEGCYEHTVYAMERRFGLTVVDGHVEFETEWTGTRNDEIKIRLDGYSWLAINSYQSVRPKSPLFDSETIMKEVEEAYQIWHQRLMIPMDLKLYQQHATITEEAIYLLWVNFVSQKGKLTHDAIYCSKNYMNNTWSWDYLFMVLALATVEPEMSQNQLSLFWDNQDDSGCLPDYINEQYASFSCVKPPIQGVIYRLLMKENDYFLETNVLEQNYEGMERLLAFWLGQRHVDGRLPIYYHGNDSGWDNATVFLQQPPIQTPDLTAYLVSLCDQMAEMADVLAERSPAQFNQVVNRTKQWRVAGQALRQQADTLFQALMEQHFDGRTFFSCDWLTGQKLVEGDSLLHYLPLILGKRLGESERKGLVKELVDRFECCYGLATENPASPYYQTAGYWRGPIWAPTTYLMIQALRNCGEQEIARRLADKFLKLVAIGGMAENFDPMTGQGNDDQGFSWTAAVCYQLLKEISRPLMEK